MANRILLLTVGLVLFVSLTVLSLMWLSVQRYAQQESGQSLQRASSVVEQNLGQRIETLRSSAEVLTADFGFKQAVASGDQPTIASVLQNHGKRIDADLMQLLSLNGEVMASTSPSLQRVASAPQGEGVYYTVLGKTPYVVIQLPVRAPLPIAMAVVGFELDGRLLQQLFQLTGTHLTLVDAAQGEIQALLSTLSVEERQPAIAAPSEVTRGVFAFFAGSQRYLSSVYALGGAHASTLSIVLTVDLRETFASFDLLKTSLLYVNLVTLILALVGSLVLSRNLTRPLSKLERAVRALARGERNQLEKVESTTTEINNLFESFNTMQQGLQKREEKITYQAQHDTLTDLLNRHTFLEQVDRFIRFGSDRLLVININVRFFRNINDTFGPLVGDKCLIAIADRLKSLSLSSQMAARCGADEYFIALPIADGIDVDVQLQQILRSLQSPYCFDGLKIQLEFCLGVSVFPDHSDDAGQLIRRSTMALDEARQNHIGISLYQEGREEELIDRLNLLEDLRVALSGSSRQLHMRYQPKLNLKTHQVDKCEALIRWQHPQRGFVSPEHFVALAEQSGLINTLTDWVIAAVIDDIAQWRRQGLEIRVAINISAQDLEREELLNYVLDLLQRQQLDSSYLIFELTERDMMSDADKALALMQRYRQQGFELSVDDYGIGQSSLSKLRQMPLDEIKIDKSFVLNLSQSESDQIIVKSTIELGHNFNLRVIAEGVEDEQAMAILKSMGCDYLQGYYLAKPMPRDEFFSWLQNESFTRQASG